MSATSILDMKILTKELANNNKKTPKNNNGYPKCIHNKAMGEGWKKYQDLS